MLGFAWIQEAAVLCNLYWNSISNVKSSHKVFLWSVDSVQARKSLEYVRGTKNVDREFNDLVEAADLAKQVR